MNGNFIQKCTIWAPSCLQLDNFLSVLKRIRLEHVADRMPVPLYIHPLASLRMMCPTLGLETDYAFEEYNPTSKEVIFFFLYYFLKSRVPKKIKAMPVTFPIFVAFLLKEVALACFLSYAL